MTPEKERDVVLVLPGGLPRHLGGDKRSSSPTGPPRHHSEGGASSPPRVTEMQAPRRASIGNMGEGLVPPSGSQSEVPAQPSATVSQRESWGDLLQPGGRTSRLPTWPLLEHVEVRPQFFKFSPLWRLLEIE